MRLKKIEEMNHYEVLNIKRSASQQEIERAFIVAKAAYQKKSLAHYNLVSEGDREEMMSRVERAYLILSNPKKRKKYDLSTLNYKNENKEPSLYRQSTQRLVIEDGESKGFWERLKKRLFFSRKS